MKPLKYLKYLKLFLLLAAILVLEIKIGIRKGIEFLAVKRENTLLSIKNRILNLDSRMTSLSKLRTESLPETSWLFREPTRLPKFGQKWRKNNLLPRKRKRLNPKRKGKIMAENETPPQTGKKGGNTFFYSVVLVSGFVLAFVVYNIFPKSSDIKTGNPAKETVIKPEKSASQDMSTKKENIPPIEEKKGVLAYFYLPG